MLGLDWRVVAAYLVNVVALYLLLSKVLYKPIKKFLDEREARFARRTEDIERRDHDVQETKAKYETLLGSAQEESEALLRDTRSTANRRAEVILSDAETQAAELIRRARVEIDGERRIAQQEMREQIVDLAVDMASRILEREVTADDHKRIVDKFLSSERVG
jgi:F-type H+-transporting ATPase subunit b